MNKPTSHKHPIPKIFRTNNRIKIEILNHPKLASRFLLEVQSIKRAGYKEIELDFSEIKSIFPNAAVPVAGTIEFYTKLGINFKRCDNINIITSTHLLDPIEPKNLEEVKTKGVLNKIWRFSSPDQVFWLANAFLEELPKLDKFEKGVLEGLEWSLNEVMDNVIQHSGENVGFIMGQLHKTTKHVAFTVFDYGQGIFNTLKTSQHAPRSPLDAITLCIKEGVTRDKKIGQGNGMYGLHQIVKFNEGRLTITSNRASYFLKENQAQTFTNIPSISQDRGCSTIDFQLDYEKNVSISDALKFNGHPYEKVNQRIEDMENGHGEIIYDLKNKANGYGTRQSGERVRNDILNIWEYSKKTIAIDFEGIAVISSSFADELVGKLVIEFGFFGFNNIIRLKNMNTLIQSILQRSVSQRMAESIE